MNRHDRPADRFIALPALGIVLALALATSPASAQPSLAPETPATPLPTAYAHTRSYGLWVAGIDAAGLVLSLATENGSFLAGSYLLGAPVVHLFHGNFKGALGSFGLRTGLVLGGMLVGTALDQCGDGNYDLCGVEGLVYGGLAGAGAALLLDWFWLAEKTTYVTARPPALLRAGSLQANPDLQVSNTGSMMLGLRGSF
jgi:hypothetical protein